jgi:hypothetical protein
MRQECNGRNVLQQECTVPEQWSPRTAPDATTMRQECDGRNSLQQDKEKEEYCRMKRAEEAMATTLHERPERGFKCNAVALQRTTPQLSCAPTANSAMATPRAHAAKLKRHEGVLFNNFHPKVSSTWTVNCLEPKVYHLRKPSKT